MPLQNPAAWRSFFENPEDILIVCAGGRTGSWSACLPGWGKKWTKAVTVPMRKASSSRRPPPFPSRASPGIAARRLRAPRLKRGQALTDVDRGAQLAIDAVDPGVEPADLADEHAPHSIGLVRRGQCHT